MRSVANRGRYRVHWRPPDSRPAVHEEAEGWSHGSSVEKFTVVTVRFNLLSGVAAGDARADAPIGHRFNARTSRKDYLQARST
ncbi:MAG: hypothetical protein EBT22_11710 [Chloroflexi bacterium]|nr:hypothetical protein [Chloroflexota bacterium]